VDVSQAIFQLKRYTHEGVFGSGIFKMVQIFVAMTPEETLYFANPGAEERFQPNFYFHWEDFNNTIVNDWTRIAADLLSIPMAHQLIGYYTIADDKDKTLKVLRSYQYFAASKISDVVHKTNWDEHQHQGGFIWHTTGSGKTLTSFKSAQLIASSGDADKVVFLLDRIELSTQSLDEYRGFADDPDTIQDPSDTTMLMSKLKSTDPDDCLIVTSIQKMSRINVKGGISQNEIDSINKKKLVFIIDECHRSVFGDMLIGIKNTFTRSLLFGFTGTPVFEENAHDEITTGTIFGNMLHKYTIANAIPDHNVLGFDLYRENTYKDDELREKVALKQAGVKSVEEIHDDDKMAIYNKFMFDVKMPDTYTENNETKHGIEHYLPKDIYQQDIHHLAVAEDIVNGRDQLSKNGKFHAILATQNIPEAIAYYDLFKKHYSSLNVVTIFDDSIDNSDGGIVREDALLEMLDDYNHKYNTTFQLSTYGKYKKDVAKRLAHKKPYIGIENDHNKEIDLLIVVTQMLTGYDSKWVNTLYVDKVMRYVDVIQAFSRTNRLFGPDKPFGIIKYYSFPYTMEQNIQDALEVYVDRPLGVFVDKLETNLQNINSKFLHIRDIFNSHEIFNFEKLPDTREDRNMFAKDFSNMTHLLEAAKLQGFVWEKSEYEFNHGDTNTKVKLEFDEATYMTLLQRYRELFDGTSSGGGDDGDFDYPIDTYITETGTGTIDAEYINSKFVKFIKNLYMEGPGSELTKQALLKLHKTFASLSQKDQRTAMLIIHDIQCGDLRLEVGKTIYDYINEYQLKELHKQILILSEATEINASMLQTIMQAGVTEQNIDEFGRFEELKLTVNQTKAKAFLEKIYGKQVLPMYVNPKMDKILRMFIMNADDREKILKAYLNDNITLETATVEQIVEQTEDIIETPEEETPSVLDIDKIKNGINGILSSSLSGVQRYMRPIDEIVDSVFYVLGVESIDSLDGVGMFISSAFSDLFAKENATIVNKFVAFNLLVTKYEAYLKKLYYLIHQEEVRPQYEGYDVTWKDVIHGFQCLWQLKYNPNPAFNQMYQSLTLLKGWRNDESHISPTASEQELELAINTVVTMYFFVTGSNITELESAGYDMESTQATLIPMKSMNYRDIINSNAIVSEDSADDKLAAETNVRNLPEQTRIEILRKSIIGLINYGYTKKNAVFTKQRHWEAVYRIAADLGFVIDFDYQYFKKIIDGMNIANLPSLLTRYLLDKLNNGVYAKSFSEWTSSGLTDKKLQEYEDMKRCAEIFKRIVEGNVPK
jgi:type I restriction enzyme R subunit